MSFEERLESITLQSEIDWTDKTNQYRAVGVGSLPDGTATAVMAVVPVDFVGVMQTNPNVGEAGTVGVHGVSKVRAGGPINTGGYVTVDATGSFVAGGVPATDRIGLAMSPAAAAGDIFSMLISGPV